MPPWRQPIGESNCLRTTVILVARMVSSFGSKLFCEPRVMTGQNSARSKGSLTARGGEVAKGMRGVFIKPNLPCEGAIDTFIIVNSSGLLSEIKAILLDARVLRKQPPIWMRKDTHD